MNASATPDSRPEDGDQADEPEEDAVVILPPPQGSDPAEWIPII